MSVNFYKYLVYRDVCMLLLWNISAEQIPLEMLTVAQEFASSNGTRILLSCLLGSNASTCYQAE
jgi:spore maturation protein SpmA